MTSGQGGTGGGEAGESRMYDHTAPHVCSTSMSPALTRVLRSRLAWLFVFFLFGFSPFSISPDEPPFPLSANRHTPEGKRFGEKGDEDMPMSPTPSRATHETGKQGGDSPIGEDGERQEPTRAACELTYRFRCRGDPGKLLGYETQWTEVGESDVSSRESINYSERQATCMYIP